MLASLVTALTALSSLSRPLKLPDLCFIKSNKQSLCCCVMVRGELHKLQLFANRSAEVSIWTEEGRIHWTCYITKTPWFMACGLLRIAWGNEIKGVSSTMDWKCSSGGENKYRILVKKFLVSGHLDDQRGDRKATLSTVGPYDFATRESRFTYSLPVRVLLIVWIVNGGIKSVFEHAVYVISTQF
jgi:hypothetical protein